MYHNILVPISFDEDRDVGAPLKLARLLGVPGAKVTLLHVVERIPSYALSYLPADYMASARVAIRTELDKLAESVPGARGEVISGHSGKSILDWAKEHEPDLIIMASHRPGMQDLLLGSTATHVVRHAGCAVHVVR